MVSLNAVTVPAVKVSESLVQVAVVAGPPVEIHVRVNSGVVPMRADESNVNVIPPGTVMFPGRDKHVHKACISRLPHATYHSYVLQSYIQHAVCNVQSG